ncbi:RNA helicase Mov10l1 like protein [Argiope bruennichi]|uniref:RNA helicase n=1 Tax=Argiope bruennichi TaxID=94029 RepID=A0A8T0EGE2_ARGBR|nr:RNA helicase Mov10l1 like protein [Argiope bruennichi]
MFTLLTKFASLTLDWNGLTGHRVKEKVDSSEKNSAQVIKLAKKNCSGKITSINSFEEYGVIDSDIFFPFSAIYAGQELSAGDSVLFDARRKEVYHCWTASRVELVNRGTIDNKKRSSEKVSNCITLKTPDKNSLMANKDLNSLSAEFKNPVMDRTETIEQIVSVCNGRYGRLKDGVEFFVEDGEINFVPVTGDILSVTVLYNEGGKKVVSWKPKEIKCIEGDITACENDCGVINDEIMFFRNSCRQKVNLYVGQKVSAMIASSEQGLFKWRAFSLCTSNDDTDDVRKPYISNKDGIYITEPLNFNNISLGKENDLQITVQNNTSSNLVLQSCYFQNKKGVFYIGKGLETAQCIPDSSSVDITIHCRTEAIGQHEDFLLFEFTDCIIKRNVTVTVVDPLQHILNPSAPFSLANKKRQNQLDCENLLIIPGRRPYKPVSQFSNKLPPSLIPKPLLKAVQNRQDLTLVVPSLYKELTMHNYVSKFSTLLHLEEIQVRYDMKKFDLSEAILQRKGEFLSLEVEGLAEGRPSLIIGDKAILVPPYQKSSFAFEGCIHEVHQNAVLLKFSDSFHTSYDGESYDVRFELNRTNFRRLHQCVHHVSENHEYAIFPSKLILEEPLVDLGLLPIQKRMNNNKRQKYQAKPSDVAVLQWKNNKLNWKQKEAVMRILECRCRPLPYIIFGPPGTGKTVTLVEAVLQVYENIPESRIIICTPSNSAADLVAQRIIESDLIDISEMVRLNSYQRSVDSIPEFIRPYCQDKDSMDHLTQYRIVISTCSTAGSLYTIDLCHDFFTHVFIDEAGQLMEPESDIAVGFIDSQTEGQVIMAGDPKQLGPVLRSSHALTYGLQVSYLERLMNTALYARNEREYKEYGGYNPLLVTMLEESYRSHPDILRFPSDMFYYSRVVCRFPMDIDHELVSWDELPNKGFPVIFHGVKGEELREQNSPSWFNPAEVVQVAKYLQKLYNFGLSPNDVGIIAPYKKQVEKIRMLLTALNLEFCKIGSVEEFQGQERRAIIISTVRSSDQYVSSDLLYNLGFMSNPKRLNVAITRSQELLIVVGNPHILSKDLFWHSFVRYCVVNGCYTGCELPLSFIQNKTNDV